MRLGFQSTFHVAVPNLRPRDSTWVMYRDNGKENGNYRDYEGNIGVL